MIKYLNNIIKFTKNHQKYDITPKTKIEDVNKILAEHGYDTFNATLLISPKYTEIKELEKLIINNVDIKETSYEYLIKLSYRDMIECACIKRQTLLLEYENKSHLGYE